MIPDEIMGVELTRSAEMSELCRVRKGQLFDNADYLHIRRILEMGEPIAGPLAKESVFLDYPDVGWIWQDGNGRRWGIIVPSDPITDLETILMETLQTETAEIGGVEWLLTSLHGDVDAYFNRYEAVLKALTGRS